MFWMNIWINLLFSLVRWFAIGMKWTNEQGISTSIEKPTRKTKKKKKGRWLLLPQSKKKRLSNIPLFGHVSLFMFSYCDGRVMVRQPTPKASGISFTLSLHHEIKFVFFSLRFFFSILNLALISFSNWSEISNGNGDRKCFALLLLLLLLLLLGWWGYLRLNVELRWPFLIFLFLSFPHYSNDKKLRRRKEEKEEAEGRKKEKEEKRKTVGRRRYPPPTDRPTDSLRSLHAGLGGSRRDGADWMAPADQKKKRKNLMAGGW